MTLFIIFGVSISLIIGLFTFKHFEITRGNLFFLTELRAKADQKVLSFEARCALHCTRDNARRIMSEAYNIITHKFARITAYIAKRVEWRARSVAHKSAKARENNSQQRENTFLKDVQSHKNRLDTEIVARLHKL